MANEDNNIKVNKTPDDSLSLENLTWQEYKYRHELCWNLLFKITLVVATLSSIPYVESVIPEAKRLVIFTPVLGIVLSVIGRKRLSEELKLLDKIRYLHRKLQNEQYRIVIHTEKEIKEPGDKSNFTRSVERYMSILIFLAMVNFIVLLYNYK